MNPVPFKQANVELQPPPGMTNCGTLPVFRYNDGETQSTVWLSCWRMSWRERLSILLTGRAWLWVHQFTHPPVSVTGQNPFACSGWQRVEAIKAKMAEFKSKLKGTMFDVEAKR